MKLYGVLSVLRYAIRNTQKQTNKNQSMNSIEHLNSFMPGGALDNCNLNL